MDVDTMTTEKRTYLMRKGLCFKCEKPGHLSKDCDNEGDKKGKGKTPQKRDIKAIHALFQGLTKAEQEELLALSKTGSKEENAKDEDF